MTLTTVANVKSILKIDGSDQDTVILSVLTGVSAELERYMDRELETKSRTKYLDVDWDGQKAFQLSAWPVSSLAAYNDSSRAFTTAISADSYTFLGDDGMLIFDNYTLVAGAKTLKVVWTGGLAANVTTLQADYPDIELAARLQSAFVFEKRTRLGMGSVSVMGSSVSMDEKLQLLPDVKDLIARYRRQAYVGY